MLRTLKAGVVLPLMIASALALSACTASTDGSPSADPEVSAAAPGEATDRDASTDTQVVEKGEIFASQEVVLPDELGTALVEIEPLRVDGKVQVMTVHVTPRLSDSENPFSLFDLMDGTGNFTPRLYDNENLKEYNALEDSNEDTLVSDPVQTRTGAGGSFTAWAVFAAPEDDIERLDVSFVEWMPQFLDVPVEE